MMQVVEVSRSITCLLLENKKQNMLATKTNLKSIRVLESTRRKDFEIHQRKNRQKSKFLLISIIRKKFIDKLDK